MKIYNCKNEELPVIAEYLLFSLKRDLSDFMAFSPKFNNAHVTTFDGKIKTANNLIKYIKMLNVITLEFFWWNGTAGMDVHRENVSEVMYA
jgi:hypothetical protein